MKISAPHTRMSRAKDRPRLIIAIDTSEGIRGWGECCNHGPDRALVRAARVVGRELRVGLV